MLSSGAYTGFGGAWADIDFQYWRSTVFPKPVSNHVIPSGPFNTANGVVVGGDPGTVSSTLRLNLSAIDGNTIETFAQTIGSDVVNGVGTSIADVLLRLFLQAGNVFGGNIGGSQFGIDSFGWIADNPWLIQDDGGDNYPFSDTAAPPNTVPILATCCTLNTFTDVLAGRATPLAGFEPSHWGQADLDGVAVVPMYSSWSTDVPANITWTLAHLEAPFRQPYIRGSPMYGITLDANHRGGRAQTSLVRVPGPRYRVLYVVVDEMRAFADTIRLVRGGIQIDFVANNLVGGAAVDIEPALIATIPNREEIQVAIARWVRMCGSEADWNGAYKVFADVFARHYAAPVFDDAVLRNFWQDQQQPQYLPPIGTAANFTTPAGLAEIRSMSTVASGQLANDTRPTHFIGGHDPIKWVSMAAHFYVTSERVAPWKTTLDATRLCVMAYRDNTIMALLLDTLAQNVGMPEVSLLAGGSVANVQTSMAYADKVQGLWSALMHAHFGNNGGIYGNTAMYENNNYRNIHHLAPSCAVASVCRLSKRWIEMLGGKKLIPDEPMLGTSLRYTNVRNPATGVSIYKSHYDAKLWANSPELRNMVQKLLWYPDWTPGGALAPYGFHLVDEIGHTQLTLQVQFSNPTDGFYVAAQIFEDTGELRYITPRPVPLGASPSTVVVPDGVRQYTLGVGPASLIIFGGKGMPYPITYARYSSIIPLGNPNVDSNSSDLSFLDGWGAL